VVITAIIKSICKNASGQFTTTATNIEAFCEQR
jgi:hypothetical protein